MAGKEMSLNPGQDWGGRGYGPALPPGVGSAPQVPGAPSFMDGGEWTHF